MIQGWANTTAEEYDSGVGKHHSTRIWFRGGQTPPHKNMIQCWAKHHSTRIWFRGGQTPPHKNMIQGWANTTSQEYDSGLCKHHLAIIWFRGGQTLPHKNIPQGWANNTSHEDGSRVCMHLKLHKNTRGGGRVIHLRQHYLDTCILKHIWPFYTALVYYRTYTSRNLLLNPLTIQSNWNQDSFFWLVLPKTIHNTKI